MKHLEQRLARYELLSEQKVIPYHVPCDCRVEDRDRGSCCAQEALGEDKLCPRSAEVVVITWTVSLRRGWESIRGGFHGVRRLPPSLPSGVWSHAGWSPGLPLRCPPF